MIHKKISRNIVIFCTTTIVLLIIIGCTNSKTNQEHSLNFIENEISLKNETCEIFGTLMSPAKGPVPVALIISGSGPTDRNGNNPQMQNNSLKMLADELSKHNIASLRYDKRGIGKSKIADFNEVDLRFEDYIEDTKDWIALLKKDKRFSKVIIVGHSEGSLIGMIAANQSGADTFVSIAGAGEKQQIVSFESN